jgi:hypothetical protein
MATNTRATEGNITLTVMQNLISTKTVDVYERVTAYTFNTGSKTITRNQWGQFNFYPVPTSPPFTKPDSAIGQKAKIIELLDEKLCNSIKDPVRSPKELYALMQDLVSLRSAQAKFYSEGSEANNPGEGVIIKLVQKYAPPKPSENVQTKEYHQTAARDAAFLTLLGAMTSALDGGGMAASISDSLYGITKMLRNKP